MKKTLVFMLIVLLLVVPVFADEGYYLDLHIDGYMDIQINELARFPNSDFNNYGLDVMDPTVLVAKVLDSSDNVLYETTFEARFLIFLEGEMQLYEEVDESVYLPIFLNEKYIVIENEGQEKLRIELPLCDDNGACDGYENHLSCSNDCPITKKDGVCEDIEDVCDLDCYYDADCRNYLGDLNLDGNVDFRDLPLFTGSYDCSIGEDCYYLNGDFNDDGKTDFNDLPGFNSVYGTSTPTGAAWGSGSGNSGFTSAAIILVIFVAVFLFWKVQHKNHKKRKK